MDRQTDRPTCAKQYVLSSSKAGHKNLKISVKFKDSERPDCTIYDFKLNCTVCVLVHAHVLLFVIG